MSLYIYYIIVCQKITDRYRVSACSFFQSLVGSDTFSKQFSPMLISVTFRNVRITYTKSFGSDKIRNVDNHVLQIWDSLFQKLHGHSLCINDLALSLLKPRHEWWNPLNYSLQTWASITQICKFKSLSGTRTIECGDMSYWCSEMTVNVKYRSSVLNAHETMEKWYA